MHFPARTARILAIVLLAVTTACGTSPRPTPTSTSGSSVDVTGTPTLYLPSVPPPSPTPAPTRPGVYKCASGALSGTVQPIEAAAGSRYAMLILTNNGPAPCTLYGYAGLQLLGHDSATRIPTDLRRNPAALPNLVHLVRGAAAIAELRWSAVSSGGEPVEEPCRPEAPTVAVTPPDQVNPLTARWYLGPVCDGGKIIIDPFRPSAPPNSISPTHHTG